MNIRPDRLMNAGILVIFLSGSLTAQVTFGQADRRLPAAVAPAESPKSLAPPALERQDDSYVIGDDDVLNINVWKEPDLSESVPVRSDGKVSLPLIGDIQAAGRTPAQLEQETTAKLRTYIMRPDVTVIVMQMNSKKFNVLGRVSKPGAYSLSATTTALDAIAEAGGFSDFAKKKDIYILRHSPDGSVSRIAFNYGDVIKGKHPEENITLEPHDTIIVP